MQKSCHGSSERHISYIYIYLHIYIYFVVVYVQIVMQRYKDRSLHTRKMHTIQAEANYISNIVHLYSLLKSFWSNLT